MLDKSPVALLCAVQWLLASDAELRQQPPTELTLSIVPNLSLINLAPFARPQRKGELQLQRILLRYVL